MRYSIFVDHVDRIQEDYKAVFRQGELDGACGLYSLFMCFTLFGLFPTYLSSLNFDSRTRKGRFIKQLEKYETLFSSGLCVEDLQKMVRNALAKDYETDLCKDTGKSVLRFTVQHILHDHPVILGIKGKELEHWITAAGLEYYRDSDTDAEDAHDSISLNGCLLERIYLLDPSESASPWCLWNSFLQVTPTVGGRYPYALYDGTHVGLEHALAVFKKF
jgi:hypothetical protein